MQTILEQGQICVRQRCEMCRVSIIYIRKLAKRGYFYKQRRPRCKIKKPHNREDPDAKLKSHIMLHFIRVYTVCYGKKELQA